MSDSLPAELDAAVRDGSDEKPLLVSQLVKTPLLSEDGETVGRIEDIVVRLGIHARGTTLSAESQLDRYPLVVGFLVRTGTTESLVQCRDLSQLNEDGGVLKSKAALGPFERRPGEVLLRKDVLNHSLIDMASGKLVKAADILLCRDGDEWRVLSVDTRVHGLLNTSLFRRKRETGESSRDVVDWLSVEPLVSHVPTAKLRLPLHRLRRLHPAQIADIVEDASHEEGEEIIAAVHDDPEFEADVFEEMDPEHQVEFLRDLPDDEAASILAEMAPDDAADLISDMDRRRRVGLLQRLPEDRQEKVKSLLNYNPATAGGMMNTEFVGVKPGTTVAEAIAQIRATKGELPVIYVIDDGGHLVGSITPTTLLRASPDSEIGTLMDEIPVTVQADADSSDVAVLMADFNMMSMAVVDENDQLLGVIAVDDVLEMSIPWSWRKRMEGAG